jgi:hypothetical protein
MGMVKDMDSVTAAENGVNHRAASQREVARYNSPA